MIHAVEEVQASRATLGDYLTLTKPRIIALLVVTAYCAMVVADGRIPPLGLTFFALLGLAMSTAGAHAVNMWYDRDIDAVMSRTRRRPLVTGKIPPQQALWMGIGLELASIALVLWRVNSLTAVWTTIGFLFYVVIYTIWLKRRTPQNIVIGGAAGSIPPLVGWAAVTGHMSVAAWLMFLIIFLWTPPHFWSLALYKRDDYQRAGVPMMPVVRGERSTKWQSAVYAVLLLGASIALYATHVVDVIYLVIALIIGLGFIAVHVPLLREHMPQVRWAKRTFHMSLWYMTGIFFAMVAGGLWR
ncbi:heme o synthase [Sulfobacillus harzensis]|uniref:Protoheme IX farnesyltransferase n=1 Tax=Sulfobacillus harzensis TaxID=2729629 RepID=A0A7Y0L4N3_9FIRM|nr:protoheme IX farnesyltransferase [Sulfobacillus harzensis]